MDEEAAKSNLSVKNKWGVLVVLAVCLVLSLILAATVSKPILAPSQVTSYSPCQHVDLLNNGICDPSLKNDSKCGFDANDCKDEIFIDKMCAQILNKFANCSNNELLRANFPYCSAFIPYCPTTTSATTTPATTTTEPTDATTTTTTAKEYVSTTVTDLTTTTTGTVQTTTTKPTTTTTATTTTTYGPPVQCPMVLSGLARNEICDAITNTIDCDFDGGDCCLPGCNYTVIRNGSLENKINASGCNCIKAELVPVNCSVNRDGIRDSKCHDALNTPQCFFDGGDCCLPSAIRSLPWCVECMCKEADTRQHNATTPIYLKYWPHKGYKYTFRVPYYPLDVITDEKYQKIEQTKEDVNALKISALNLSIEGRPTLWPHLSPYELRRNLQRPV